jgi:hypothetical protein
VVEITKLAMAVVQVAIDAASAGGVARIIRVRDRESFQDSELRFDQVQPRRFRGSPHGVNAQTAQQGQKTRMVMDIVQVVQNHEQPPAGIASPQPNEGLRNFSDALPASEHTVQPIGMYIVESKKLLRASQAAVRRMDALRLFPVRPTAGSADKACGCVFF